MKKIILILLVAALIAVSCLALFGCTPAAAGTYSFSSVTFGGNTFSSTDISNVSLVLNSDKTYSFSFSALFFTTTENGTWTADGKTITFIHDDISTTATYESGTLTWSNGAVKFVFTK